MKPVNLVEEAGQERDRAQVRDLEQAGTQPVIEVVAA